MPSFRYILQRSFRGSSEFQNYVVFLVEPQWNYIVLSCFPWDLCQLQTPLTEVRSSIESRFSSLDKIWQATWIQTCLHSRSFWLVTLCLSSVLRKPVKMLLYGEKPRTNKRNAPEPLPSNWVNLLQKYHCVPAQKTRLSEKGISIYSQAFLSTW